MQEAIEETKAASTHQIDVYCTGGKKCGIMEVPVESEQNPTQSFSGTITVRDADGEKVLGTIDFTQPAITAHIAQTDSHEAITGSVRLQRGDRPWTNGNITEKNGQSNPAYPLARLIAENTERSTTEVKQWLSEFKSAPLILEKAGSPKTTTNVDQLSENRETAFVER